MEKQLERKLRGWQHTENIRFVVLRDQDSGDCYRIKANLQSICHLAGKPDTLVRIACHELETFYLGNLAAVSRAFGRNLHAQQQGKKFRQPDNLNNAKQELKKLVPEYQEIAGSRAIAPLLMQRRNMSQSFNVLIQGIQNLL